MPLEFLKKKGPKDEPEALPTAPLGPPPEEIIAADYVLKLYYAGKSSEGVRMQASGNSLDELPSMLAGLAQGEIEVVPPLPIEYSGAMATITRTSEAMQWLNAHHGHSPITRHGLFVLETLDAIDMAFDTVCLTLLDGDLDTSGYPEYSAIVGGVASHWDEATGDLVCRAVIGWGGKGVRGDTDRIGSRLIGGIVSNILASRYAMGLTKVDRPLPSAGRGGVVCASCGFASAHERAFYCPKCGMRLMRG